MKIKRALLSECDPDSLRLGSPVLDLDAGPGTGARIRWSEREDLRYGEVRRYVTDPKWAARIGNDDTEVLTDWFQVWQPRTIWLDGDLVITGFMRSVKGIARNGISPRTGRAHPNPLHEEAGEPFVMVEWVLR